MTKNSLSSMVCSSLVSKTKPSFGKLALIIAGRSYLLCVAHFCQHLAHLSRLVHLSYYIRDIGSGRNICIIHANADASLLRSIYRPSLRYCRASWHLCFGKSHKTFKQQNVHIEKFHKLLTNTKLISDLDRFCRTLLPLIWSASQQ